MIRNRYNKIPHQTDIEIKDGSMYFTACIKQHKERAKWTAYCRLSPVYPKQSEQKFEDN